VPSGHNKNINDTEKLRMKGNLTIQTQFKEFFNLYLEIQKTKIVNTYRVRGGGLPLAGARWPMATTSMMMFHDDNLQM
jgi:hypothetical protein